jgi:hypothetical protein
MAKKPAVWAAPEFSRLASLLSKRALIDICWGLSQLGTDESTEQIITKFCREAVIILPERGDWVPSEIRELAARHIDSD